MSPLQASVVNTCLIDSDRGRKGALNSDQCPDVREAAVDSQREGVGSQAGWRSALVCLDLAALK